MWGEEGKKSNVILKKFEILKIQIFVNLFSTTQRVFQKLILKKKKKKKERKKENRKNQKTHKSWSSLHKLNRGIAPKTVGAVEEGEYTI